MKPPAAGRRGTKDVDPGKLGVYSAPSPKVSRQKKGKSLTGAERAAFLASRPDLKPKA